jgi:hypothetical protein
MNYAWQHPARDCSLPDGGTLAFVLPEVPSQPFTDLYCLLGSWRQPTPDPCPKLTFGAERK